MRVYEVTHKDSGKGYVGATTRSLDERMARHFVAAFSDLRNGTFYAALRRHGIQAFEWKVVVECASFDEMWAREKETIASRGTFEPDGFNQTRGGLGGGWKLGRERGPMSEAERRKRSVTQKGRKPKNAGVRHTYEARQKMRGRVPWNKGKPRTEAEKAKMRDAIQASSRHGDHHPKSKPIECDGTTYQSVRDMERRTGLSRAGIYYRLSKGRARFV